MNEVSADVYGKAIDKFSVIVAIFFFAGLLHECIHGPCSWVNRLPFLVRLVSCRGTNIHILSLSGTLTSAACCASVSRTGH